VPDLDDASTIPIFVRGYDRSELFVCSKMTLLENSELNADS